MTIIIKFVNVLIIFLSLFHVAKNDDNKLLLSFIEEGFLCFKDSDCPYNMCPSPLKEMCYFIKCVCGVYGPIRERRLYQSHNPMIQ
ncbi:putative Late nodulin [Medicago truncatula]|uniref:Nodule Cysteine-Rich (NCR) secreted peptide n=1 Tax=Medicago truncatula TaxID=3880 RepID=A7KHD9_MEDTR|nr:nodule-specific cysteine-rich peptide 304 [Medicago truncatula]AES98515.1 Nodule Cysteine-Rich (NCR) secreted peptide [Medicago truncatula]RHN56426.1 putative Late nodulin [Medicago truncatula]